MSLQKTYTPIPKWDPSERPREKMLAQNAGVLSDVELIALLIGSGCGRTSAIDLARDILVEFNSDLNEVSKKSAKELCKKFKGIGEAKATCILAGLELGKRIRERPLVERPLVKCSKDAFEIFSSDLSGRSYEIFQILMLSQANRVIRKVTISEGGSSHTVADPKKIFKIAIDEKCSAIIMAHNHPSGNLKPSADDIALTHQIISGAKLLEISILDHIIIGEGKDGYFSFAENDLLR